MDVEKAKRGEEIMWDKERIQNSQNKQLSPANINFLDLRGENHDGITIPLPLDGLVYQPEADVVNREFDSISMGDQDSGIIVGMEYKIFLGGLKVPHLLVKHPNASSTWIPIIDHVILQISGRIFCVECGKVMDPENSSTSKTPKESTSTSTKTNTNTSLIPIPFLNISEERWWAWIRKLKREENWKISAYEELCDSCKHYKWQNFQDMWTINHEKTSEISENRKNSRNSQNKVNNINCKNFMNQSTKCEKCEKCWGCERLDECYAEKGIGILLITNIELEEVKEVKEVEESNEVKVDSIYERKDLRTEPLGNSPLLEPKVVWNSYWVISTRNEIPWLQEKWGAGASFYCQPRDHLNILPVFKGIFRELIRDQGGAIKIWKDQKRKEGEKCWEKNRDKNEDKNKETDEEQDEEQDEEGPISMLVEWGSLSNMTMGVPVAIDIQEFSKGEYGLRGSKSISRKQVQDLESTIRRMLSVLMESSEKSWQSENERIPSDQYNNNQDKSNQIKLIPNNSPPINSNPINFNPINSNPINSNPINLIPNNLTQYRNDYSDLKAWRVLSNWDFYSSKIKLKSKIQSENQNSTRNTEKSPRLIARRNFIPKIAFRKIMGDLIKNNPMRENHFTVQLRVGDWKEKWAFVTMEVISAKDEKQDVKVTQINVNSLNANSNNVNDLNVVRTNENEMINTATGEIFSGWLNLEEFCGFKVIHTGGF